jgi:Protein of Unknown function (DUF2784)
MIYHLAVDLVLIVHLAFVIFVLFGAVLALRWPRLIGFHLAALLWGVLIEFTGAICPLTPLEMQLRQLGGESGYPGGFIDHYLVAALYPSGLTRRAQIGLGFVALVPNALAYSYWLVRQKRVAAGREVL